MTDIQLLKALADPSRAKIVELLLKHSCCVKALSLQLGLSESAVSQHLKVLRDAGLVEGIRYGYYTHYRVNRDLLKTLQSWLESLIATSPVPGKGGCGMADKVGCTRKNDHKGDASPC